MEPDGLLVFSPIYKEKVWGGRKLESAFGRALPEAGVAYGESWELVDREGDQSVVEAGRWAGRTLGELWSGPHRLQLFGSRAPSTARFPLLVKILDAREWLSLQVHPPEAVAGTLGGEPKTEMWYTIDCEAGAQLIAGLKPGAGPECFESAAATGDVGGLVHRFPATPNQAVTIPGGRIHAIGPGVLLFEIQQNSDTTYRVFDWKRGESDGKPRELHLDEALCCIDFTDIEPSFEGGDSGRLSATEFFTVDRYDLHPGGGETPVVPDGECAIVGVMKGSAVCGGQVFGAGCFFLITATRPPGFGRLGCATAGGQACVLVTTFPDPATTAHPR